MRANILGALGILAFTLPFGIATAHAQDAYGSGMRPYNEWRTSPPHEERAPPPRFEQETSPPPPPEEGAPPPRYEERAQAPRYHEESAPRLQPTIAVEDFTVRGAGDGSAVANGMRELLIRALRQDRRFRVVHAEDLDRGGADVLIEGAVNRYRTAPERDGWQRADIDVSFRLIDATSGRPLGSITASGYSTGPDNGYSDMPNAEAFRDAPLGQAGEQALSFALPKIAYLVKSRGIADRPHDDMR